jgi:hypothetical protein
MLLGQCETFPNPRSRGPGHLTHACLVCALREAVFGRQARCHRPLFNPWPKALRKAADGGHLNHGPHRPEGTNSKVYEGLLKDDEEVGAWEDEAADVLGTTANAEHDADDADTLKYH